MMLSAVRSAMRALTHATVLWCLTCGLPLASSGAQAPKTLAECEARIPESLRVLLKESYPTRFVDLSQWRYDGIPRDHRCGVAVADFDGNGEDDVALMLTPKGKGGTIIVVALKEQDQWHCHVVHRAEETGGYLAVAPARKYVDLGGKSYRLTTPGIESGDWDSSSFVIFWRSGKWIEFWTSD